MKPRSPSDPRFARPIRNPKKRPLYNSIKEVGFPRNSQAKNKIISKIPKTQKVEIIIVSKPNLMISSVPNLPRRWTSHQVAIQIQISNNSLHPTKRWLMVSIAALHNGHMIDCTSKPRWDNLSLVGIPPSLILHIRILSFIGKKLFQRESHQISLSARVA